MNYQQQMLHIISTQSLAKMAFDYSKQDSQLKLSPDDIKFWDAISAELIRRGAR